MIPVSYTHLDVYKRQALTPMNVGACMLGAILGLIVGAMPGIGSLAGVALLLPLTYKFNPATAIIMPVSYTHLPDLWNQ